MQFKSNIYTVPHRDEKDNLGQQIQHARKRSFGGLQVQPGKGGQRTKEWAD